MVDASLSGPRLLSGNEACAEGALAAGVRFFAGYPITPSSEIAEFMARRLPPLGGVFLQMEDEIASFCACIGASLAGLKAMDATSGPGLSLKAESLSLATMMEVPCVLINAMRVGPSTGMATSPAQGDMMMARWGSHGDHPAIVLAPSSVAECFDLTVKAVNLSERFRNPVIVLTDAVIARLREVVRLPREVETVERRRPIVPPGQYRPYAAGDDGVPAMADFGQGYHWYANSSMHDEGGFEATSSTEVARVLIERLHRKISGHRNELTFLEEEALDDAEVGVVAFGSVARAARGAVRLARAQGIRAGLLKLQTIWPFPEERIASLADQVRTLVVPEMSLGQLADQVRQAAQGRCSVHPLSRWDGRLIAPEEILVAVKEAALG